MMTMKVKIFVFAVVIILITVLYVFTNSNSRATNSKQKSQGDLLFQVKKSDFEKYDQIVTREMDSATGIIDSKTRSTLLNFENVIFTDSITKSKDFYVVGDCESRILVNRKNLKTKNIDDSNRFYSPDGKYYIRSFGYSCHSSIPDVPTIEIVEVSNDNRIEIEPMVFDEQVDHGERYFYEKTGMERYESLKKWIYQVYWVSNTQFYYILADNSRQFSIDFETLYYGDVSNSLTIDLDTQIKINTPADLSGSDVKILDVGSFNESSIALVSFKDRKNQYESHFAAYDLKTGAILWKKRGYVQNAFFGENNLEVFGSEIIKSKRNRAFVFNSESQIIDYYDGVMIVPR